MYSKKAQAEDSVNWVFVLVAGGVILLFFGVLIFRFQLTSEKEGQALVLNNLNSMFSGIELSSKTHTVVSSLPDQDSYFNCQGFTVGDFSGNYQRKLVFAPNSINLNPLLIWAYDLNLPFYVTNLLLLSSPNKKYIFVYDQSSSSLALKSKLEKVLPEQLDKEFLESVDEIEFNGGERVVFLGIEKFDLGKLEDYTALQIDSYNGIQFFENEAGILNSKGSSIYLDTATMLGAIFVEDLNYYNCMMDNVVKRATQVAFVLKTRKDILGAKLPYCGTQFGNSIDQLYDVFASTSFENLKLQKENVVLLMKRVEEVNKQLQVQSCPSLY